MRARAEKAAEERVIDALVGSGSSSTTRESFKKKLRNNELNDKEIDILVADTAPQIPMFDMPGGASMATINLGEMLGKALGQRTKPRRVTVKDSFEILIAEESDKLIDNEQIVAEAVAASRTTASYSWTRSTRSVRAAKACAAAPMSRAKACSAISCH